VKVLFVMRHPAAVRSLGSVLRLLDARGHTVHLAFRRIKTGDSHRVLWDLTQECEHLTFGRLPGRGSPGFVKGREGWDALAERLRFDSDYLRYLEPAHADAPALRARAARKAHPYVHRAARVAGKAGTPGIRVLRHTLQFLERCLVPPPQIERFVGEFEPDVLAVTHLAELGSSQSDYVRAAARLGRHTAYQVFSWDNLTNKGLVHDVPELTLVWNELQVDEAVDLQEIPRGRVKVTGASAWDHWFEWTPSRSREDFCADVGLRADRPLVLYVCSSHFVAPDEVSFVRRWIAALRAHGGALAEAGVIVRPHPRNSAQWGRAELDEPQVAIWPRFGEEPLEEASRRNFFDSIFHSAAVVGINTSAQIESAIVGRPVHTVLDPQFAETQQGTLHFQYLRADDFGHLYVGRTMAEHMEQLEHSLRGEADPSLNERFLLRFVRPLGLDVKASPIVVDSLEELAARPRPKPARGPLLAPVVRLALTPVARAAAKRQAEKRREKVKTFSELDELRRQVRKLGRDQDGPAVVAGPWEGDEVAELLYWIPFLRWAQVVTFGLKGRLVVRARPSSARWYEGIGSDREAGEDALELPAEWLDGVRSELSGHRPGERPLNRPLEFAPVTAEAESEDVVAVEAGLDVELDGPVVRVAPGAEGEALAVRSRRFVGCWGPLAIVAALAGVPTVAVLTEDAREEDVRLATTFLPLHAVDSVREVELAPA
jgi:hypothetical protein